VSTQAERAARFLELHRPGEPLLLPNPWDAGSATILASLGFEALATTSSGHAATTGALDGSVTREQTIAHAATVVQATELPVSADLENCFADDPEGVAETVRLALEAASPVARSRTTPLAPTSPSTTSLSPPSGSRRLRRPLTPGRSTSS
jgi:2-methylisocitrate lyase-like PEP mutase family enzyme